ncbi:MAG: DEAD/DEAH box helicase [Halobacteriota archaeon]
MVDFRRLLHREEITRSIDPLVIFEDLDKESTKEYLRPPQKSLLKEWYENLSDKKDIIVKLHTGQGKTLVGLLMLQVSLKEGKGPAVYICPNKYLVAQTVEQAQSFGIETVEFTDGKPPREFLNSQAILVTNCKKMFNGKSVFGVAGSGKEPIQLGAIVLDDAHKCLDIIRESFSIIVKRDENESKNPLYNRLFELFKEALKRQAPGTYSDIYYGDYGFMAVPYWDWYERQEEVLEILHDYKESYELRFVWDLLKDKISQCICLISGRGLEITPRLLPLELIPSFSNAQRRIFLSATLTEDAFLVKDLGIEPESVLNPLSSEDVKYSGERLILMPSLVDPNLKREDIIQWLSDLASKHGNLGFISIVPSFYYANDWKYFGADVASGGELYQKIDKLKTNVRDKNSNKVLVFVNAYDGIDLPDNTCRILCLDLLPSYSSLIDKYAQALRPDSKVIRRQLAQRVEQGIGRGIRGSSDWCIVVIAGNPLTEFLSEDAKRAYLSNEAQMQIKIGEELADQMRSEGGHIDVMETLIKQCLNRDAGWKEYYKDRMGEVEAKKPIKEYLDRATVERDAEILYQQELVDKAVDKLEELIAMSDPADQGWYLQTKANYLYPIDPAKSMDAQLKAFTLNNGLFRPPRGISYTKLNSRGINRASLILDWIGKFETHNALTIKVNDIMEKVAFGTSSNLFEEGILQLGEILGFVGDRPEKETGEGPDNLWHIQGDRYWVIECKNRVDEARDTISRSEAGQMNVFIGWFDNIYEGDEGLPIFIHPARELDRGAYLSKPSWVLQPEKLETLKSNVRSFYYSLKKFPFDSLSSTHIIERLETYHLKEDDLKTLYLKRI